MQPSTALVQLAGAAAEAAEIEDRRVDAGLVPVQKHDTAVVGEAHVRRVGIAVDDRSRKRTETSPRDAACIAHVIGQDGQVDRAARRGVHQVSHPTPAGSLRDVCRCSVKSPNGIGDGRPVVIVGGYATLDALHDHERAGPEPSVCGR